MGYGYAKLLGGPPPPRGRWLKPTKTQQTKSNVITVGGGLQLRASNEAFCDNLSLLMHKNSIAAFVSAFRSDLRGFCKRRVPGTDLITFT